MRVIHEQLIHKIFQIVRDKFFLQVDADTPVNFQQHFQWGEDATIQSIGGIGDGESGMVPVGKEKGKVIL